MVHLKRIKDSKSWLGGDLFFDAKDCLRFSNAFNYIDKARSASDAFDSLSYFEDCLFIDDLKWSKEAEEALSDAVADFKDFIAFKDTDAVRYIVKNDDKSLDAFADFAQDKYGMACLDADFKEAALSINGKFVGFSVFDDDPEIGEFVHCNSILSVSMVLFQGSILLGAERYFNSKGRKSDSRKISDWNVLSNTYLSSLKKWLKSALGDVENIDERECLKAVDLLSCEYEDTVEVPWDKFELMTSYMNNFYDSLREKNWKDLKVYGRRALDLLEVLA